VQYFKYISLLLLLLQFQLPIAHGQQNILPIKVNAVIYNNDTIPYATLPIVIVMIKCNKFTKQQQLAYNRLQKNILVVYPYVKKASYELQLLNQQLASLTNKSDRKRAIKITEKKLSKQFKEQLVNMTTYQGRLLMLLIDRETGHNCYSLVKDMKGGVLAWSYNAMMTIYDEDLNMKRSYSKELYPMIEQIMKKIEGDKSGLTLIKL
jgi:hypothetical protein